MGDAIEILMAGKMFLNLAGNIFFRQNFDDVFCMLVTGQWRNKFPSIDSILFPLIIRATNIVDNCKIL